MINNIQMEFLILVHCVLQVLTLPSSSPKRFGTYELHAKWTLPSPRQTRMALKTAGFLAAIERVAQLIFQANPGKIYILNEMKNTQATSLQTSFYVSIKMNLSVYRNP